MPLGAEAQLNPSRILCRMLHNDVWRGGRLIQDRPPAAASKGFPDCEVGGSKKMDHISLVSSPLALSPYRLASFACPLWYSACRLERILEERLRDLQWKLLIVPDGKAEKWDRGGLTALFVLC